MKYAEMLSRFMEEDAEIFAESLDYHRLKVIIKNSTSEKSFLVVLSDEVLRLKGVYEGRTWALVHQAEAMLKKAHAVSAPTVDALVLRAVRIENFFHLNVSGIRKICKKFIKYVTNEHVPTWEEIGKPFITLGGQCHGRITFLVSQLFQRCKTTATAAPVSSTTDLMHGKSLKFVIEDSRALEVTLRLAKRVPLVVHDAELTVADESISTVYYDNPTMDTCNMRGGADYTSLLRVRFYGKLSREGNVFVERKIHEQKGKKEESEKERFTIPVGRVHQFLYREWDPVPYLNSVIDSPEEVVEAKSLAEALQAKVASDRLVPAVRTVHDRMAFEMMDSGNVLRVTVDSQMLLIKEDGKNPKQWAKDHDTVAPVFRMRHAVLEVKTVGDVPPDILEIIKSVSPLEVNFSKFRTGCAVHYPDVVLTPPEWFSHTSISDVVKAYRLRLNPKAEESPPSSRDGSDDGTRSPDRSPMVSERPPPPAPPPPPRPLPPLPVAMKAPPSHAPIRVEPKTYFANERTFLHWQHQSMLILLLGTAMLSYHPLGMQALYTTCGFIVMVIGAVTILYSLHRFYWRLRSIETGDREGYIDRFGPPFVSVFIFIALSVVLATVLTSGDEVAKNPLKSSAGPGGLAPPTPGGPALRGIQSRALFTSANSLLDPVLDAYGAFVLQTKTVSFATGSGKVATFTLPANTTALGLMPLAGPQSPQGVAIDVLVSPVGVWRCTAVMTPAAGAGPGLTCVRVQTAVTLPASTTAAAWHGATGVVVCEGRRSLTYVTPVSSIALPIRAGPSEELRSVHIAGDRLTVFTQRGDASDGGCLSEYDLATGNRLSQCVPFPVSGARTVRPSTVDGTTPMCLITSFMPSGVFNEAC